MYVWLSHSFDIKPSHLMMFAILALPFEFKCSLLLNQYPPLCHDIKCVGFKNKFGDKHWKGSIKIATEISWGVGDQNWISVSW